MNAPVKFYQTGTFTVGNRLLAPEQRSVQSSAERSNSLNSGHRACQGCGEALGARYAVDAAMRATDNQLIAANATGCLEVFSTPYPETSWQLPWIHSLFGNAAAVGTGIAAALKVKAQKGGNQNVRVIAQGGDGGTTDIGFGCLSGMFERNDDVLYICYDNEAYMNTGVQRSSATPPAARTATTMAVGPQPGRQFRPGQEPAADRDGARDPLCRHRHRGRPARPGGQGREGDEHARRALPAHPGAVPAGLGLGQPRHHPSGAAGARDRHLPGVRGRARRGDPRDEDPPPRAGGGIPASRRNASRTCSARHGHPEMLAKHPGRRRPQHPRASSLLDEAEA